MRKTTKIVLGGATVYGAAAILQGAAPVAAFPSIVPLNRPATFTFQPLIRTSSGISTISHPNNYCSRRPPSARPLSAGPPGSISAKPARKLISRQRATAVYALMLCNLGVFLVDKVLRNPLIRHRFYLFHNRWRWWQLLTSCFCHADLGHLKNNLFLLLLFGRSVEDDLGWGGLLLSFVFCGVVSSLVSIFLLPKATVSIGASGAVFGLFAVSNLSKLAPGELIMDWRKLVEVVVLGEFAFRQVTSEVATAAGGGTVGINHVAHLSGAAAGAILMLAMRAAVNKYEKSEER